MQTTLNVTDWETLVKAYAADNDMSYGDAMTYLCKRDSLETAASLLGALDDTKITEYRDVKPILNSFGSFLDRRGYRIPKMFCRASDYVKDAAETKVAEVRPDKPELTRELYLRYRREGISRTVIFRKTRGRYEDFKAKVSAWGFDDPEREADAMANQSSEPVEPSQTCAEYKRTISLNLTLTEAVIRESINALVEAAEPRTDKSTMPNVADVVMGALYHCKQDGVDIASMLVQKLRDAQEVG